MHGTHQIVLGLIKANPDADVTEDRVRWVLRRGLVTPKSIAGRLVWSHDDVLALAAALDLVPPALDDEPGCVAVVG